MPIASPALIDRERELAAGLHALDAAVAGQLRIVLIAGEAGIGKSRLLQAITAAATERGFAVHQALCSIYDRTLPFASLIDLLRARLPAPRAQSGETALPWSPLAALLPDLFAPVPTPPPIERPLLVRAIAGALSPANAAPVRPVVLAIEDIHWADAATLECLPELAQRLADQPLVLALTYRSDEVSDELARALQSLARQHAATVPIPLASLTATGVQQMIGVIFAQQRPVRLEFARAIHELADGNPFFIEEILQTLVHAGDIFQDQGVWTRKPVDQLRIPRSITDTVRIRTAALTPPQHRVLQLAAILGRRFRYADLRALSDLPETELVATLRVLVQLQVFVEVSADAFAFRHALAREAVMTGLLAIERRPLHAAVVRLLERSPRERMGELAYHCAEAGQWEQAAHYAQAAGEQALVVYAATTAVEHLSRALTACARLGRTPDASIFLARGRAFELVGATASARDDYTQAAEQARAAADPATECAALLALGFLWVGQDYVRAGALLDAALARARETGRPELVATTLNRVGNWHLMTDEPARSIISHREALTIAEAHGDTAAMAASLDLLGIAHVLHGDMVVGGRYYAAALAHWRALRERQWIIPTLASFATRGGNALFPTAVCSVAPLDQCVGEAEEALAAAREIGWLNGEGTVLIWLAALLGPRGEALRALAAAEEALALAHELDHQLWINSADAIIGSVELDLYALDRAAATFARALAAAEQMGSAFVTLTMRAYLALTLIEQRHQAAAAIQLSAAPDDLPAETQAQQLFWYARARYALATGAPDRAAAIADRLLTLLDAPVPPADAEHARLAPRLWLLRGEAAMAMRNHQDAERWLRAAAAAADSLTALPLVVRSAAALAHLFRRHRRADDQRTAAERAEVAIEEVARRAPASLQDEWRRRALALLPARLTPTRLRALRDASGGLSAREREVAALVARGRTNRAIAVELTLSERTVEKHIENIMAKLALESRTQIAVWAVAHGLAHDT